MRANTRSIVELARKSRMSVTGVTKVTCGNPAVAKAMISGGVDFIGDSRMLNIVRMKRAGVDADMMLLRTPALSEVGDVVDHAYISLNTELDVIARLSDTARDKSTSHLVVVMVEMGELREGVPREELNGFLEQVLTMEGVELHGLGMNLACFSGVVPTRDKIREFSDIVDNVEDRFDISLHMIGGGNSANIPLLLDGHPKSRINNLRIGEGILLGIETVNRTPIPGLSRDAFTLEMELIELKDKPSVPDGEISQNAFGETPVFKERGVHRRGILAGGRQDVKLEKLEPVDDKIEIIGGSSDHIVVEVGREEYVLGDVLEFRLDYSGLLAACTSEYVKTTYI